MKNNLFKSAALVAAMVMTMSGCSNEELTGDNGNKPEVKGGITTVTLETPQGGPSTRLEYNTDDITNALGVKWKAGKWVNSNSDCERALVVNAGMGKLYGTVLARTDAGEAASTADFKFYDYAETNSAYVSVGSIGLLYPHKAIYSKAFDLNGSDATTVKATLPLSGQTGKLVDMQDFDYMTAVATVPTDNQDNDAKLNISFKHRIAVMRLTGLTLPGVANGEVTNVTISGTNLKTDAELVFTKGVDNALTQSLKLGATDGVIATTGTFTTDADGKMSDVYICFFPKNVDAKGKYQITNLNVIATVGNDTYEYSYSDDASVTTKVTKFVEGKMYTLKNKIMTKLAPEVIWATGNLVANGANSCKIGEPTDGGLYFQFGSLVGWAGGESGDGTGQGKDLITPALSIFVKPTTCNIDSWDTTWAGDPEISTTDDEVSGKGDPCRYYLKGTWRLPTSEEYARLFKNHGYPSATSPWKWDDTSKYITNSTLGLTLPTSGYRNRDKGALDNVNKVSYGWSATPNRSDDIYGVSLYIGQYSVYPVYNFAYRTMALPVRCVHPK